MKKEGSAFCFASFLLDRKRGLAAVNVEPPIASDMRSCRQRPPRSSNSWPAVEKSSSLAPQRAAPSSSSRPTLRTANRASSRSASSLPSASSSTPAATPSVPSSPVSTPLSRVYLQVTPLEGLEFLESGPAQLSPHAVVVLEIIDFEGERREEQEQQQRRRVFAFDFLPREPQRLSTAQALFSGKPVKATGRERRLGRVPRRRCVLVGEPGEEKEREEEAAAAATTKSSRSNGSAGEATARKSSNDLLAVARAKLRAWDATPLVWLRYDCTHAAIELAAELAKVEQNAVRRALKRACSS